MVDPDPAPSLDDSLLTRAVAGDRLALNELLLSHFDALQQFIARRAAALPPGMHATDDLLQETFVRAIRGIRNFEKRQDGSFEGWLRTIAENVIHSAATAVAAQKRGGGLRPQQRPAQPGSSSLADLVDLLVDDEGTPSAAVARHEMTRAVQVGIAELPDEQRDAVRLRFLQGQSLEQTATELGRTPAAVRGLLHRAKARLRDALGRSSRWFSRK